MQDPVSSIMEPLLRSVPTLQGSRWGGVASFHVQHYVWLQGCREVDSSMRNVTGNM